jgi:threonine/homoserine/homoserine lactone efflux protein
MGLADPATFALAVLALLATPGPTNTLLATSGAAAGFQRSFHLVVAEMAGYMISITTLALVIGPIVRESHDLSVALRIACAAFLFYSAWKLWREGAAAITSDKPVSFRRVLIATALNPKGIVFAFVIVPHLANGQLSQALPYMAALLAMIGLVGGAWIAGGATLRAGTGAALSGGIARRAGALTLCVFAAVITGSTFTT